jgi:hypothetical protein
MTQRCINCNRSDEQTPLFSLAFKGEQISICPQCLPVLIHRPEELADKLPGIETPAPGGTVE